jgi:hypothetical protein
MAFVVREDTQTQLAGWRFDNFAYEDITYQQHVFSGWCVV